MKVARILNPMLTMTFTLVVSVVASAQAHVYAVVPIPAQYTTEAEQHRNFLIGLGFEDYSLQAQSNAEKFKITKDVNPVVVPMLERTVIRMKPLAYAREAGVLARIGLLNAKKNNREKIALKRLSELTAYHLLPFTLQGLEPVPESVFKLKIGNPAAKLREEHLIQRSMQRYTQEKKAFIAAFLEILFSEAELKADSNKVQKTIQSLDLLATEIIQPQYLLTVMQQNRYLGRALAATLLQFTRENNLPNYEDRLRKKLLAEGVYLDNHVTSTLTYKDRASKIHKFKVYNGDIANEYSAMSRAYQISSGVLPAPRNAKAAERHKLVGSLAYFPFAINNSHLNNAIKKKRSNMSLNEDEERALREVWDSNINRGFSHAGIVEVKSESRTGISMVWIWDIYPRGYFGGVRLQTPENFAHAERFLRLGFVRYDPEKAFATFQKQIQTRGFISKVWESTEIKMVLDEDGDPDFEADPSNKKVGWYAQVPKEAVYKWSKYSGDAAANWYDQEAVPRAMAMFRKYLVGREVLGFASNFRNISHTAYCTQIILLAFLQSTNFDMQSEPDVWRGVSKVVGKMGMMDVSGRVIAPAGFAWQEDLISSVNIFELDRSGVLEQENNAPHLNGKPTVVERRLRWLQPLLLSGSAQAINTSSLIKLDPEKMEVDDDDLD